MKRRACLLTVISLTLDGKLKSAGPYTAAILPTFITGIGEVVALTGVPAGTLITLR